MPGLPPYSGHSLSKLSTPVGSSAGQAISITDGHLSQLQILCNENLRKYSVRVDYLSERELLDKTRCARCQKRCKTKPEKKDSNSNGGKENKAVVASSATCRTKAQTTAADEKPKELVKKCKFHPGKIRNKQWSCCNKHVSVPDCRGEVEHIPEEVSLEHLTTRFQYVATCHGTPSSSELWKDAVAIDCEMGTSKDLEPEIIRLTVIDYFSSEVLIDSLVWPDVPMLHCNTRYSGVSWQQLWDARRSGNCILGVAEARELVWKYVGPETIVVGHGLSSDFKAMRWLHTNIVDSFLIEQEIRMAELRQKEEEEREKELQGLAEAAARLALGEEAATEPDKDEAKEKAKEAEKKGCLKLKSLAEKRLGIMIQMGNRGHDSVEDALAARNLVDWHVRERTKEAALLLEASEW